MTRGGKRKGAGRKPTGPTRAHRHIYLTQEADRYFQMIPKGQRSTVVSNAILAHLAQNNAQIPPRRVRQRQRPSLSARAKGIVAAFKETLPNRTVARFLTPPAVECKHS